MALDTKPDDVRVSTTATGRYRIARQASGGWHLYRDDQLIDVEYDPERSPLEEIFRWANAVVWT